ncbi:MAG: methyl-accepting chemotaxis protein [Pseudogulbenkiania sp.]|nr:methyl-accepting chemotaxis protein [Pseudogulbenkiania sp.]
MAIRRIAEWFIPDKVRESHELVIRARTVISVGLLAGLVVPVFALSYFKLQHPAMAWGILAGGAGLLLGPLLLKLTGAIRFTAEFIVGCMFAMVCWMSYVNGGILSSSVVWYASIPFTAIFVGGRRSGMVWTVLTLLAIAVFLLLDGEPGALPEVPIAATEHPMLQAKSLVGLSLVVLSLALAFDKAKALGFQKLEAARAEAERASQAMQQMMEQVTRSIHAASCASREIAASTTLMARTMAEQGQRTEAMVVSAQQMAVVTGENAEQSISATRMAEDAGQAASDGGLAMDHAVAQLNQAGQVISHAASQLETLEKCSREVSGIVQLIRGIAEQTNLLALNAAIEAARAGEMGRGFAVVADEVRKLAERTQGATLDIEQKIRLIVDGTNQSVGAMLDGNTQMQAGRCHAVAAQDKLAGIIRDTHQLGGLLQRVSSAEAQQNQGFADFAGTITTMGEATRTLAAETGTIADATRRLDSLIEELGASVTRFHGQTA